MKYPGEVQKEVAISHLFAYLETRPGDLLFAFEPAYQAIAELYEKLTPSKTELLSVYSITSQELHKRLTQAEKFICAFNRTFEKGFTEHVATMIERSTTLSRKAFTLSDISRDFFDVFQAKPERICELNKKLIEKCREGSQLRVQDNNGTDLLINLDNKTFDWISIDGFTEAHLDLTYNLPPGEIATYSPETEGVIYFTGGLLGTIPIGRKYGFISDPIKFTVIRGRIADIETRNKKLKKDLEFCLSVSPFSGNVCEIGIGTNEAITSLYGLNYTFEEKHKGFHIGFGATLAQQNNVERMTNHHLDLLFADSSLYIDGKILYDGEFHV
jgi:leucyl aminopeptidase (aminopeptidase T)